MTDNPQLQMLLDELLDSPLTPEEVCGACPELLPELRLRWQQMRRVQEDLDELFPLPHENYSRSARQRQAVLPLIPGYEVEALIGQGGMGIVFKARHLQLNRLVAIKMLLAGAFATSHDRRRFHGEAKAVAGLQHPNVVQIYDVGDSAGQPYFTMELVEGGSLAQKLRGAPQPVREAARLVASLADAVEAAHKSGIVHRDLKPANILLTAEGKPKVSDFGLARRLDEGALLTRTGVVLGTPGYMSPEQARGPRDAVGPAADIYSLGAMLYELLTGRPPFHADTPAETIQQVITQDPLSPSRLNPKIPSDLETICLKCLHKSPLLRYASAMALTDELERFLRGEAITARPEGKLSWLARQVRRRPSQTLGIAASVLFAVIALFSAVKLYADRAATERKAVAERIVSEQIAEQDLREMVRSLQASSWSEAQLALERAKTRLGDKGSSPLVQLAQQGARELDLANQLDALRLNGLADYDLTMNSPSRESGYEELFRKAGFGEVFENPDLVANRIRQANIHNVVLDALDHWSSLTIDVPRRNWLLSVARKVDLDAPRWRDDARNDDTWANEAARSKLLAATPFNDPHVALLLHVGIRLVDLNEKIQFLQRVHFEHPQDLWVNLALSNTCYKAQRYDEGVGYCRAALTARPNTAVAHVLLGMLLLKTNRNLEEGVEHFRRAARLEPTNTLVVTAAARTLELELRFKEGAELAEFGLRAAPNDGLLNTILGNCLRGLNRNQEALIPYQRAAAASQGAQDAQQQRYKVLLQQGEFEEARLAWHTALEAQPVEHLPWYGYAELCLFLGQTDEYRRARSDLLSRFGKTTDPYISERIGRACLLLPAAGDELSQAVVFAKRTISPDDQNYKAYRPYFEFAGGLADYRQGNYDKAIATMRGDAASILGPAPRLVLAMALYHKQDLSQARRELATAILAKDWNPRATYNQDGWICHILRREAEQLIVPDWSELVSGERLPQDSEEQIFLLGIRRTENRLYELTQLYTSAVASDRQRAEDVYAGHRYRAAVVAALAASGDGSDASDLSPAERSRLRAQARQWLRADLAFWKRTHAKNHKNTENWIKLTVSKWSSDPDLASLREPLMLQSLSDEERQDCDALWTEVRAVIALLGSVP